MAWSEWKKFSSGLSVSQGLIKSSSGTKTFTFDKDTSNAYIIAGQASMKFYLNGVQIAISVYGTHTNNIGLFQSNSFSAKKGDVLSISSNTTAQFGYMIFY